ncbi:hypothetical protein ACJX0J_007020, partial [Zea mays]
HGLIHWQDQWLAFTHDQQRVHEKRLTHNGHFDYWSKSWDLHLQHVRTVFSLLQQHQFKVKLSNYITLDMLLVKREKFLSLWHSFG